MSTNTNNVNSIWNAGDYRIEFAGTVIGEGKVSWHIHPEYQSIRMDQISRPQSQRVKSLQITLHTQLEKVCSLNTIITGSGILTTASLDNSVFQDGQTLRLHPISPLSSGWEFQRAYLNDLKFNSNDRHQISSAEADFCCEAANADGVYISPLAFDSTELPAVVEMDISIIKNALTQFLTLTLQTQVQQEVVPLTGKNTFTLCSSAYQKFDRHMPRELSFTLLAVVPAREKDTMIRQLTDCANQLQGKLVIPHAQYQMLCQVEDVTFNEEKAVSGTICSIGKLKFRLLTV